MRLIDADKIIEVAEHAYGEWNKAMAAAEGRQINRCYKMQELCKAVKGIADDCPIIDPESLRPTAHWIKCDLVKVEHGECTRYRDAGISCSKCKHVYDKFSLWDGTFCPGCGSRMIDCEDGEHR